jgi:hypothetical protein
MTGKEKRLFRKYIGNAGNYLEFGCGGSTISALKYSHAEITAIDSGKEFIEHLIRDYFIVARGVKSRRLNFVWQDIGPLKNWGMPADDSRKENYPAYSSSVFKNKKDYDVVLIDGRFRVACALQAILNAPDGAVIMIHDFYDRPYYHVLLQYLEVADRADTLGVFRKKKNIDMNKVKKDWDKYKFDYK